MTQNRKSVVALIVCFFVFAVCLLVCVFNLSLLKRPIFQGKTDIRAAASAKYEKDGNLYIIDSGSFRFICMTLDGKIRYTINIDKMKEYSKIYDSTIDDAGNLYVYVMEMEYDAFLTKRDIIRKYDRNGKFIKDIFTIDYTGNSADKRPHAFPQFGSLRCEDGILTFSQVQKDRVKLYSFDTFHNELSSAIFSNGVSDFSVARLASKDFDNFIYSTRGGGVYEVKDGGLPLLRASFDFTEDTGGVIPWYLDYDSNGTIVFFDMVSATIFTVDSNGNVKAALPSEFFNKLREQGMSPALTNFGFFENRFAGVYGDAVWYYDGAEFTMYGEDLMLSAKQRFVVSAVQFSSVLGLLAFLLGIYILFVHILDSYISLFIKQSCVIIPITIAAFIVLYEVTFNLMQARLTREIFNELNLVAMVSAELIDGDDVESLKSTKDFQSDAYKRVSNTLKKIVGNNKETWNKAYYAAIYKGKNFEHWVAISSDEMNMFRTAGNLEEDSEDYELFMSGKAITFIGDTADGSWAVAEVPITNREEKIVGMFEIALDMTSYQIGNKLQQQRISVVASIICLVILVVLILVVSLIVKQLVAVANVLGTIASGDYSARVYYKSKDELGTVSYGLNSMAGKLQKQFDYITRMNESTLRFVPVQFMEHLGVADITKMQLGDYVQQNITVLFFDIRSFSINSEIMSAKENFTFINKVLGISGPIIRAHNGFVDKYLGDAAMALFTNTHDAVLAGIEIYQKIVLDESTMVTVGGEGINIGVGIHSGTVMMGIIGENERLSSTVISKNVNMASRLESLTKQTKSGLLISREVLHQIPDDQIDFQYRFIGMLQPAGVNEVVGVFDVLDALPEAVREKRLATKKDFEAGVLKYHSKDYETAHERFTKVVDADPSDVCAANCLAETKAHLKNPKLPSVFIFNKK